MEDETWRMNTGGENRALSSLEIEDLESDVSVVPLTGAKGEKEDVEPPYTRVKKRRRQTKLGTGCCLVGVIIVALCPALISVKRHFGNRRKGQDKQHRPYRVFSSREFPVELLNQLDADSGNSDADAATSEGQIPPPYDPSSDFCNDDDRVPPFWEKLYRHLEGEDTDEEGGSQEGGNDLDGGDDNKDENSSMRKGDPTTWGPCYPPAPRNASKKKKKARSIDWPTAIRENRLHREGNDAGIHYPSRSGGAYHNGDDIVPWNKCRPGFLIIGAGKCGTSSLYHYLAGHERVLPASEKQIHYFKYYASKPMSWYLSHFPGTETFLASGALMTGEASPGYLPYPYVAKITAERLPGPRIICAGREPLDRAWSSYNYNYVNPTLQSLRAGAINGIEGGKDDDYYREHHLFTFEEMIAAELAGLRKCLLDGKGEKAARKRYHNKQWASAEIARRDEAGEPGLIDIEEDCYPLVGTKKPTNNVPRFSKAPQQWSDLIVANPDKVWETRNIHLTRSLVGRGLYVLPLEWWYVAFPSQDIYLVCTEDLRDHPINAMSDLSKFLGLPYFNYTKVIQEGMFNMGNNRGYDTATPWNNTSEETKKIPISDELLKQFQEFVQPFNERLFALTGRRCPW